MILLLTDIEAGFTQEFLTE